MGGKRVRKKRLLSGDFRVFFAGNAGVMGWFFKAVCSSCYYFFIDVDKIFVMRLLHEKM